MIYPLAILVVICLVAATAAMAEHKASTRIRVYLWACGLAALAIIGVTF